MAYEADVLLNFDIDEAQAVNSIKDLRQANSQLRAERDKVNISTKEGQDLIQKLNTTIDKNNKLIKDNSSALEKQRQNVGNYSKSIQEAAGELNIMGTNVGQLGSKLASFVNPVSATVGVITALGTAYANSTIGAKDLEFAQGQLSTAMRLLSNDFAGVISSAEDGEGLFTIITNSILFKLNPALALTSRNLQLLQEQFEDLARNERLARGEVSELLSENQEKLTKIQDSQTEYADKVHLVGEILVNINAAQDKLTAGSEKLITNQQLLTEEELKQAGILTQQLQIAQQKLNADEKNEKLLDERNLLVQQIQAEDKKSERTRQGILRIESNLKDQEDKRLETLKKQSNELEFQRSEKERQDRIDQLDRQLSGEGSDPFGTADAARNLAPDIDKLDDLFREANKRAEDYRQENRKKEFEDQQIRLQAQSAYFNAAATLAATAFGEGSALFKALAIGETIINTYSAATAALAPPPLGAGPLLGPALAAATIAAGLANVARITDVGFAEGGYTGSGAKYQPAGIVHKDEYVTPSNIVHSPAAQPHLMALESMRTKGYADGGFVANTNLEASRQAQMMQRMIANLPAPVVQVVDINREQKKVLVKERMTRQ